MNKLEFTEFLKNINLSKREFAELSNISYNTVNNWNDENRPVKSLRLKVSILTYPVLTRNRSIVFLFLKKKLSPVP